MLAALILAGCGDKEKEKKVFTITFDADGGAPVPPKQTVEAGGMATVPQTNPAKQGFVFMFWSLNGANAAYNFQTPVTGNITLKAKWEEEAKVEYWQVAWELNDGAWAADYTPPAQVAKGGTLAEPTEPVKAGSTFEGWYREAALTNKVAFPYNVSGVTANITLFAKWNEESVVEYWQVAWELNDGAWAEGYTPATQVEKDRTLAEPTAPVKADNTFDGWYREAALTNKVTFPYDVSGVTANFTLYAKWADEPAISAEAMVASGFYSYFFLQADGTLHAYGRNNSGQLGVGGATDVATLTQVATDVAAVNTRHSSSFIVKKDGNVFGTGHNYDGQLGLGDNDNRSYFTELPVNNVKTISTSSAHTLLLKKDGSVWATGWNWGGELGTGDKTEKTVFTATNLTSDVVAISAGGSHSLALKQDGTVWGTGINSIGELGLGYTPDQVSSFVQIFSGAKAIAAGGCRHSLILANNGTVYTAGLNGSGELGIGNDENFIFRFIQAIDNSGSPLSNVSAIATGHQHSLALKSDGSLWATGLNDFGQLGTGDNVNRNKFTQVAAGVKSMSAGADHTVILKNDGTIEIFGVVNPYENVRMISWSLDGGAWPVNSNHVTQVANGGYLTAPNDPVKTGKTFAGWYTDASLTNPFIFPYKVTGDITLFAKWGEVVTSATVSVTMITGTYQIFIRRLEGGSYVDVSTIEASGGTRTVSVPPGTYMISSVCRFLSNTIWATSSAHTVSSGQTLSFTLNVGTITAQGVK